MDMLIKIWAVFVLGLSFYHFILKRDRLPTASGAVIMGGGIFMYEAVDHIPFLSSHEKELTVVLALCWIMLAISLIWQIAAGNFRKQHLQRNGSLAIGTWVAATSVAVNVLIRHFSDWQTIWQTIAFLNVALWLFYIRFAVRPFYHSFIYPVENRVHGAILLPTVSTQSLVILLSHSFGDDVPQIVYRLGVMMGLTLYFLGLYGLLSRFCRFAKWNFVQDWLPSNCMIHGAMSISGLAAVVTGAMPKWVLILIWSWAACCFLFVEILELIRLYFRIKKFGAGKGFGEYHVLQWSRIFTFGMFYTFTYLIEPIFHSDIYQIVLGAGPWVVFVLLVNQILLWFKLFLCNARLPLKNRLF